MAKKPVTIRIDQDIMKELGKLAEAGRGGGKYQTLINEILRENLFESEPLTKDDVFDTIQKYISQEISRKTSKRS